jgi:hypothetical protein
MGELKYYTVRVQNGNEMEIEVEILKTRTRYFGRLDVMIKPVNGRGEVWVSADSLHGVPGKLKGRTKP